MSVEVKSAIPYDPQVGFAIHWGLIAMSKESYANLKIVSKLKLLMITGIEWPSDFCLRSFTTSNSRPGDGHLN